LLTLLMAIPACGPRGRTAIMADATAAVVCQADGGTRVVTPTVKPRPDGVHFQVDNRADGSVYLYYRWGADEGNVGELDRGLTEKVVAQGPGTWRLACTAPDRFPTDQAAWMPMEVVDPEGLWIPSRVDCEHPTASHPDYREYFEGRLPRGETGAPVEQARDIVSGEVPGWRPEDVVETAGYPEAVPRLVRVVRDGRIIAVLDYRDDGQGGWFYGGIEYCEE
jgi:hypothetical protein